MSEKILQNVQKQMQKKFGDTKVMSPTDMKTIARITYGISSQSLNLDLIIGRPGYPAGRMIEIFAAEGTGKSLHGYHALAETQRQGGIGVLIETEQAFEAERLTAIGVNPDHILLSQPEHLEEAFEMLESSIKLLRETNSFKGPITILFDSIAGTPSSAEVEKGFIDKGMATQARAISQALRKLTFTVAQHKVVVIFLNQMRQTMNPYGDPFVSPGGMALKFHASLRLQLTFRKGELLRGDDKAVIGGRLRAKTIKNKLNTPFMESFYMIRFANGIDMYDDLLTAGAKIGYLQGSKGRFSYHAKDKKLVPFKLDDWKKIVDEVYQGPHKLRDRMTQHAIKRGFLKPYA